VRFRTSPRDVPPVEAARRLGLSLGAFLKSLPDLRERGFPEPDSTTGHYDLKAVDAWMDRRSGFEGSQDRQARDASAVVGQRLSGMTGRA
jgi:hypothetical protein